MGFRRPIIGWRCASPDMRTRRLRRRGTGGPHHCQHVHSRQRLPLQQDGDIIAADFDVATASSHKATAAVWWCAAPAMEAKPKNRL